MTSNKERHMNASSSACSNITKHKNVEYVQVRTSTVYSKIAIMGRNPRKEKECHILISALEESCITVEINGRIVKKDPPYVKMRAVDAKKCFGDIYKRRIDAQNSLYPILTVGKR